MPLSPQPLTCVAMCPPDSSKRQRKALTGWYSPGVKKRPLKNSSSKLVAIVSEIVERRWILLQISLKTGASGQIRTVGWRFTKPLLYP